MSPTNKTNSNQARKQGGLVINFASIFRIYFHSSSAQARDTVFDCQYAEHETMISFLMTGTSAHSDKKEKTESTALA
ncbi:hypothetical protein [Undibacterium sp. TS12]|uniref:hypothetical protein n=1 Tax=Undibacterium sp. TS12 TaxID=2908202 RepID=UPI001F4D1657|nr:hypothetical protein [Undibacterium sp. TS12]MCH8621289.1 hypothetical protein [Undibacterium sp. TS12]